MLVGSTASVGSGSTVGASPTISVVGVGGVSSIIWAGSVGVVVAKDSTESTEPQAANVTPQQVIKCVDEQTSVFSLEQFS